MPPFALVRESFRFYRLKSQTLVRVLFLCAYGLSILRTVFPRDDENLQALYDYVTSLPYAGLGSMDPTAMPAVSGMTLAWFAVQAGVTLLLLLFSFAYASSYVAEHEGDSVGTGVVRFLKSTPRLFAFLFMFLGISFLSTSLTSMFVLLFFLVAGVLTMYFLPLLLSRTSMKLMFAVNRSFVHTRGHRFYIFNCLLLLTFIVNILSSLLLFLLPVADVWASAILGGFFTAALTLMHGRLMGGLYFIVVKQRDTLPDMVKKEKDDDAG
ncbi:MAG: hypothetical protein KBA30_07645 [Clostridia bacterium]|nr:hypothetical protein [Clostridia bacterium]